MKLITCMIDGIETLGLLSDEDRVALIVGRDLTGLPNTLQGLIEGGDAAQNALRAARDRLMRVDLDDITLLPPLPQPSGIFCVGLNYADHEREAAAKGSEYPTIFLRLARNQVAYDAAMIVPKVSDTLDWEGELVAVIGRGGRHITPENALSHVFGWSIYNEGSVRAYQHHSSQFGLGKNFAQTGAFGPSIVTADAFGDPYGQTIETRLNDEVVQSASVGQMTHRIEDVIAYISEATELRPGDIICTGTPAGVGAASTPPRFLKDGDTISVTIPGIGTLRNPVQSENSHEVSK